MKIRTILLVSLLLISYPCCALAYSGSPFEQKIRQELSEYISSFWKENDSLVKYNLKSYIPIWYNDPKQDKLYLVFDRKYRFSTAFDIVGYIREVPKSDSDKTKYNLEVKITKDELINILRNRTSNNKLTYDDIKSDIKDDYSIKGKMHIGVTKDDIIDILSAKKSKNKTQHLIVLDSNNTYCIYAFVGDLVFEGEKEYISGTCSNYEFEFYHIRPKCIIGNSDTIKGLTSIYSQRSISNKDFSLLKSCWMPITSTRFATCAVPSAYGRSSVSQNDWYNDKKQLLKYGTKLRDPLLFEIGAYDLIGSTNLSIFADEYNYNIAKYLNDQKLIKSRHFDREKYYKVSKILLKYWHLIWIGTLAFSILINLLAKLFKMQFSFLWLLTFSIAQATFFPPVPNPYTAIGFMNMGIVVIESILQLLIVRDISDILLIYFVIFLLYWAFLHHLVAKQIIKAHKRLNDHR